MKAFAIIAIVVALYLLYRLAFPKKIPNGKEHDDPLPKEVNPDDIVGQSRFVPVSRSQPLPHAATPLKTEVSPENPHIFAEENPPMDVEISMEYKEQIPETVEIDEEDEDLRQTMGSEASLASGFTFEEMDLVVETVNQFESENEARAAEILYREEKTECVEQLKAISPEKSARIKGLIDLHIASLELKQNNKLKNMDISNFDIADFLS